MRARPSGERQNQIQEGGNVSLILPPGLTADRRHAHFLEAARRSEIPEGLPAAADLDVDGRTVRLKIIWTVDRATDGTRWEHVSATVLQKTGTRTPTWDEMCIVKAAFWHREACVVQFHPAASDYTNIHPHVLHLWRPVEQSLPFPNVETSRSCLTIFECA